MGRFIECSDCTGRGYAKVTYLEGDYDTPLRIEPSFSILYELWGISKFFLVGALIVLLHLLAELAG